MREFIKWFLFLGLIHMVIVSLAILNTLETRIDNIENKVEELRSELNDRFVINGDNGSYDLALEVEIQ